MMRLALLLVPILLFTACEADEDGTGTASSASATPTESAEAASVMPALVGMKLDEAYDHLANAGLSDKDAIAIDGGGTFGVIIESNWTVCDQNPAPGEPLPEEPTLAVDRSCETATETESGKPDESPSATDPAAPTTTAAPAVKPRQTTPDRLYDLLNADGTKLGERFKFVGELSGQAYWSVGAGGEYFVMVSVHGGTNDFEVFIDKALTAGWGNGTRVEFVVEDSEMTIFGETSDGWMKAISARKL